jgi:AcrR family transcriptional regulator
MAQNGKMGRPLGFSETEALDAAMRVFWEKGYEGSTLGDLTKAMGINRSSMYATLGDKEVLFWLAIARYAEGPAAYAREALEQPTVRAVVEALLRGALELLTDLSHPRGCLSVQGALACGSHAERLKHGNDRMEKAGGDPHSEAPAAGAEGGGSREGCGSRRPRSVHLYSAHRPGGSSSEWIYQSGDDAPGRYNSAVHALLRKI